MKSDPAVLFLAIAALLSACTRDTPAEPGAESATAGSPQKCYGVVRAARNDCAANGHSCAGQAKSDAEPGEWLYLPEGTCKRIVNGRLDAGTTDAT